MIQYNFKTLTIYKERFRSRFITAVTPPNTVITELAHTPQVQDWRRPSPSPDSIQTVFRLPSRGPTKPRRARFIDPCVGLGPSRHSRSPPTQLQIPRPGRHAWFGFGHTAAETPPVHRRICPRWLLPAPPPLTKHILFPRLRTASGRPPRWRERRRRPVVRRAPWLLLLLLPRRRRRPQQRRSSPSAARPPAAPPRGPSLTSTGAPRCPSSRRHGRSGRRARARPPRTRAPSAAPYTGVAKARSRPRPRRRWCPAGSAPRGARPWPTRWCASPRWRAATTSGARWRRSCARLPRRRAAAPTPSAPRPAASPPCPRRPRRHRDSSVSTETSSSDRSRLQQRCRDSFVGHVFFV
jgi:hypothetical protein